MSKKEVKIEKEVVKELPKEVVAKEEPKKEVKAEPKKKSNKKDSPSVNPEEDTSNVAFFTVGEEVKVKDLTFVCKEVLGCDIILTRKDFK